MKVSSVSARVQLAIGVLKWGVYGGSRRWSFGAKLICSVMTRMEVSFVKINRRFARGVNVGFGGRFSEGSTTGVTNDKKRKGINIKLIVGSDCYGKWVTVYS